MSNLITVEEFATFRDISKKRDESKISEAIGLAQQSDLLNILGDFYFDVLNNAEENSYILLMTGGVFEYCNEQYEHAGIKKMLADYTYARYMMIINVNHTPFGSVTKMMQDSEKVDRATLRDLSKQAQQDAGFKFKYIEKYILSEPTLFSRYCKNKDNDTSFQSFNSSII